MGVSKQIEGVAKGNESVTQNTSWLFKVFLLCCIILHRFFYVTVLKYE